MKRIFLLVIISLFSLSLINCERDDICDQLTPTTPRLVIDFYDSLGELKEFEKLEIVAVGNDSTITFTSADQIQVPLRTNADTVKYTFRLTIGGAVPQTISDEVEFNYTRENVYVSRACGYKTVFTFSDNNPVVLNSNPGAAAGNWIDFFSIETYNIETENEAHINIIF